MSVYFLVCFVFLFAQMACATGKDKESKARTPCYCNAVYYATLFSATRTLLGLLASSRLLLGSR